MATKRKALGKSRAKASDAVEQQLARYREMRDFKVTSEPSGEAGATKTGGRKSSSQRRRLPFVIQKHAASHLHYDFRLGWNGVLKSWAIAKGLSYFPGDKRLAIQVEDHPMEYGGFEGIIPKGQYGGGTVMLWDQGTWEPQPGHTDIDEGFRRGSLKFTLHGTKMKGNWTLVRMGGKAAGERKPNWLLIKERDGFERTSNEPAVTEAQPNSVVTGRDLDQIARSEDHVWDSRQTSKRNAWRRNDTLAMRREETCHDDRCKGPNVLSLQIRRIAQVDCGPPQRTKGEGPRFRRSGIRAVGQECAKWIRLAARVEARRLSHSGPQAWTRRTTSHAHRFGLDSPHEVHR